MRKTITLLDLFSGIGGFHLGLEKAGFKIKSYNSEIDKHAQQVYKHNFKKSNYVGSVTDVRASELPRINAITFGSPCQDFSLAGKRKGMGGERSSLILEAIRLVKECRPDFFIWENVKGTFSSNNRQDFAAILQAFANIGGYRLEWQLLNTKWFLPQNRERIYLVGYIGGRSGRSVFPIGKDDTKIDVVQKQTTNTLTTRYRADGVGTYIGEDKFDSQIKIKNGTKQGYDIAKEGDSINYSNLNSETRRGRVGKRVAQTLDTACSQATIDVRGGTQKNAAEMINQSPALTSAMGMGGGHVPIVKRIRRLTPIECERLQGFPDNRTQYGTEGLISDSQRYKMCGNAVTVDVVEAVGKQILKL